MPGHAKTPGPPALTCCDHDLDQSGHICSIWRSDFSPAARLSAGPGLLLFGSGGQGLAWPGNRYTAQMDCLSDIKWDRDGLVPVIAQEAASGDVLMFAWMNREALALTVERGQAVYWSRSRQRLWHKGEESGHFQQVHQIRIDCDADVVLLKVSQLGHEPGIACHTGRHSCFYRELTDGQWATVEPVLQDPQQIYKK